MREEDVAALGHRSARAADRVGAVEISDRIGERRRIDRSRATKLAPCAPGHLVDRGERRVGLAQSEAQLARLSYGERLAHRR